MATNIKTKILLPRGTVDSLSARTFTNGELVLINSGSTFKPVEITSTGTGLSGYGAAKYADLELSALQIKLSSDVTLQSAYDSIADTVNSLSTYAQIVTHLSNDGYALISSVVGPVNDLSSANTINGAKKYAKQYTDQEAAKLSTAFATYAKTNDIGISYNSVNKKIYLAGGNNTSAEIDASDFIKDGMLSSALYDSDTKKLVLVFNTDAGASDISVDIGDLVDTYTADDTSTIDMSVSDNTFTASIINGSITPALLSSTAEWVFDCNL